MPNTFLTPAILAYALLFILIFLVHVRIGDSPTSITHGLLLLWGGVGLYGVLTASLGDRGFVTAHPLLNGIQGPIMVGWALILAVSLIDAVKGIASLSRSFKDRTISAATVAGPITILVGWALMLTALLNMAV